VVERQQVGEQYDLAFVFGIPDRDATQQAGAIGLGFGAGKADELVGKDVAILRDLAFLGDLKSGALFQTGDEEDLGHAPATEQGVIDVGAIHGHNRAGVQDEGIGQSDVAAPGFGEQYVGGQVIVMVQQDVSFDAAFGTAELGPGK